MLPKTPEQFRKWLINELKRLGERNAEAELDFSGGVLVDDIPPEAVIVADVSESDFGDAAETVRRAREIALQVHLPSAYEVASELEVPVLALNTARMMLAEMLQAIPEPPPSEWLSVKQAAKVLNVSETTIRNLCRTDQLRHERIGNGRGTIRIHQDAIREFEVRGSAPGFRHL